MTSTQYTVYSVSLYLYVDISLIIIAFHGAMNPHPPCTPQWSTASLSTRLFYHSQTHHTLQVSSEQAISPTPKPLPDKTQNSQQTPMPTHGIRTHNPCRRAAAELRLRLRDHRDRLVRSSQLVRSIHYSFTYIITFTMFTYRSPQ